MTSDTWLAATTSLGLLGVIARVKLSILADFKVSANQIVVDEDKVLNGDIYAAVSPYVTANYWARWSFSASVFPSPDAVLISSGGQVSISLNHIAAQTFNTTAGQKKFHLRTYEVVPIKKSGTAFQVGLHFPILCISLMFPISSRPSLSLTLKETWVEIY